MCGFVRVHEDLGDGTECEETNRDLPGVAVLAGYSRNVNVQMIVDRGLQYSGAVVCPPCCVGAHPVMCTRNQCYFS